MHLNFDAKYINIQRMSSFVETIGNVYQFEEKSKETCFYIKKSIKNALLVVEFPCSLRLGDDIMDTGKRTDIWIESNNKLL